MKKHPGITTALFVLIVGAISYRGSSASNEKLSINEFVFHHKIHQQVKDLATVDTFYWYKFNVYSNIPFHSDMALATKAIKFVTDKPTLDELVEYMKTEKGSINPKEIDHLSKAEIDILKSVDTTVFLDSCKDGKCPPEDMLKIVEAQLKEQSGSH